MTHPLITTAALALALALALAPAALADSTVAIGGEEGWTPTPLGSDVHPAIGGEEGWRPTGPGAVDDGSVGASGALEANQWPAGDLDLSGSTGSADSATPQAVILLAAGTDALVHIDPCGDIPLGGTCAGGVLTWCDDDGAVSHEDCEGQGHACGWDPTHAYFGCLSPGGEVSPLDLVAPKLSAGPELLLADDGSDDLTGCQATGGTHAGSLALLALALLLVATRRRRTA